MDETGTFEVEVALTDGELVDLARQLGASVEARDRLEELRSADQKERKAEIEKEEQRVHDLARRVRYGKELRALECRELRNFEAGLYQLVRVDTGEVVKERPLGAGELQVRLALGPGEPTAQEVAAAIAGTFTADAAPVEGGPPDG